jgi:hypothetical protein
MTKPERVQRSRKKGSRLVSPNGLPVVCVSRGTKWGNPFRLERFRLVDEAPPDFIPLPGRAWREHRRAMCVDGFRYALERGELNITVDDVRRELRGKNLACWCERSYVCHADVLLEISNDGGADADG